jgi:hypothetical protein
MPGGPKSADRRRHLGSNLKELRVGIALDLVLYLKTQFNTRNKTRGFNLGFIPQVSSQVYNPGTIGYYTCRQV